VPDDRTPLERLHRLAQDLTVEATRADVTGEPRVHLSHEWADELIEVNRLIQTEAQITMAKANGWQAVPWPTRGLIASFCVAGSALVLSGAWVVVDAAWEAVGG
jgi:cytochrome c-type biogenesis protein CcmH/NrfG